MQQAPFGNVTVSAVPWGSAGDDGVVIGAVRCDSRQSAEKQWMNKNKALV
jgi:hypothetical protein